MPKYNATTKKNIHSGIKYQITYRDPLMGFLTVRETRSDDQLRIFTNKLKKAALRTGKPAYYSVQTKIVK